MKCEESAFVFISKNEIEIKMRQIYLFSNIFFLILIFLHNCI
jgi:hypothetical protein